MNRETYRDAFDAIPFSPDFENRTRSLLRQTVRETETEERTMKFRKPKKLAVLIAAAVALLAVSVSAAVLWLTPAQVAETLGAPALAAAFEREDAVTLNDCGTVGDYTVTLLGMASGEAVQTCVEQEGLDRDLTYAVFTLSRTDGTPLEEQPYDLSYSPLVGGYHVSAVNAWTLEGGYQSFMQDGVAYYLYDTRSLEMFADHPVYFAVYEGGVPSPATFLTAEDGTISLADGMNGVLFTLPLNADQADPAAAEAFVKGTGLEFVN